LLQNDATAAATGGIAQLFSLDDLINFDELARIQQSTIFCTTFWFLREKRRSTPTPPSCPFWYQQSKIKLLIRLPCSLGMMERNRDFSLVSEVVPVPPELLEWVSGSKVQAMFLKV
jgi:hypothetical protein